MQRMKVVLVEDDIVDVQVFRKAVQTVEGNYELIIHSNGQEALEWLSANQCDLIVCDINMPRMNGFELAQTLKREKIETPFIFYTTSSDPDDVERARIIKGAVQGYFVKPHSWESSLAVVQALLGCLSNNSIMATAFEKLNRLSVPPPYN